MAVLPPCTAQAVKCRWIESSTTRGHALAKMSPLLRRLAMGQLEVGYRHRNHVISGQEEQDSSSDSDDTAGKDKNAEGPETEADEEDEVFALPRYGRWHCVRVHTDGGTHGQVLL